MYVSIYKWQESVLVPRLIGEENGIVREVDPVAVVDAGNRVAIVDAIVRLARLAVTPATLSPESASSPPVVQRAAKARSWKALLEGALLWSIDDHDGVFRIVPHRRKRYYWEPHAAAAAAAIVLPRGATIRDAAGRMADIVIGVR